MRRRLFSNTGDEIIRISPEVTLHRCKAGDIFKSLGRVIPPIREKGESIYYLVLGREGEKVLGGLEVKEIPGQSITVSHIGGGDTREISEYFEGKGYPEFSFRTENSMSTEAKMISDPVFGELWEVTKKFSLTTGIKRAIRTIKRNNLAKEIKEARRGVSKVTEKTDFLGYTKKIKGTTGKIGTQQLQTISEKVQPRFEGSWNGERFAISYGDAVKQTKESVTNRLHKKVSEIASEEIKKLPKIK